MVRVPEGFERLLPNAMMGCRIHHQHAEKHYVSCDTTGLGVMNLNSGLRSDLRLLDVEKAASPISLVSKPGTRVEWNLKRT